MIFERSMIFFAESLHDFFCVEKLHDFFWWTGCMIFFVKWLRDFFLCGEVA